MDAIKRGSTYRKKPESSLHMFRSAGTMKNQKAEKKSAIIEDNILRQTDKSFVLAIDPETRLPFMINMGLKTADICDLDNRFDPENRSQQEINESLNNTSILNPTNYSFYQTVKRNLYIMTQLLND